MKYALAYDRIEIAEEIIRYARGSRQVLADVRDGLEASDHPNVIAWAKKTLANNGVPESGQPEKVMAQVQAPKKLSAFFLSLPYAARSVEAVQEQKLMLNSTGGAIQRKEAEAENHGQVPLNPPGNQ